MKKVIGQLWPIGFIFFAWLIFASPYFLKHLVPFASQYQVAFFPPWNAYGLYQGSVKNAAMPDVITQIYPWRHLAINIWKTGQIPLWNQYSFSGTPLLANYQSAALSPFNLLFFILPFVDGWSVLILLQPLLAGMFTYLYMRSVAVSKQGSLLTSLGFMFCGFLTTWMGYGTLGYAILFLPLSLFAIEKYYQTKKSMFLILLSFTIPLSFFSGHFQISLYFLLFIAFYIIYKLIDTKNIFNAFYVLLYTLFGLLLSMPQLLPSIEFYQQSLRSGIFQTTESIPFGYLPTFLAPDFFGNPVTRNDWFGHYAEWNGYIGILPFMLALYAILRKRASLVVYLCLTSIALLFFAFSTPFLDLLIAIHVPVLSTSAASRIIVLFSFTMAILAGFGLDALLSDMKNRKITTILIWLGVFLGIVILLWIVVVYKLFLPIDKIAIAKQNLKLPTLFFGFSVVIILFSFLLVKRSQYLILTSCFLLLITSSDLLRFATKWQSFEPKNLVFPQVSVTKYLSEHPTYERGYGNYGAQMSVYYDMPAVNGYDALYIHRYGQLIASSDHGQLHDAHRSVVEYPKDSINTPKTLNLLNIAYIIHKIADDNMPWGFQFKNYPLSQFSVAYEDKNYRVYKNNAVFPRVFLAGDYQVIQNDQGILNAMFKTVNLRKTLILEQNPHIATTSGDVGTAAIITYTPNKVSIATHVKQQALLFLSDNYYPGWQAFVDGKQTNIYRADFTFRAISIPQGKHIVVFEYKPMSFIMGIWFAVGGLVGILLLLLPKLQRR